jgi:hypothetical protein
MSHIDEKKIVGELEERLLSNTEISLVSGGTQKLVRLLSERGLTDVVPAEKPVGISDGMKSLCFTLFCACACRCYCQNCSK